MSRIHEALKRAEKELGKGTPQAALEMEVSLASETVERFESAVPGSPAAKLELRHEHLDDQMWLDSVPRSAWTPDPKRILFADPNLHSELGMEEFRTLRSRIYQLREKKPLKVLMLASAISGEGKTFVASNLAFALARQQGRRVLLIDADVRKRLLHETLGAPGIPGLNDFLSGKVEARSIVQRGPIENLFLVPGGVAVSNPSELVANGRLNEFLAMMRPLFDWIVLDSPPLVPISDGSMISRCADGILLVVKAETTPVNLVERAKQELKGLPLLGVVVNRGERNPHGYSGYQYEYTYMKTAPK